jgi:hypothetical protein
MTIKIISLSHVMNTSKQCEISSSHGGKYEAQNLVGCTAVFLIERRPTFQRCILPPLSQLPTRPYKELNTILSHSHTIPLFPFYFGSPTHLPLARFLDYHHSFPIGQPSPLDSYINSNPFTLGSLIALMMEAAHTSETSDDI